jgi:hypothetical protein
MESTFVILTRLLRYRLSRITSALRYPKRRLSSLIVLISSYSALLDYAQLLNYVFSPQLLYLFLAVFLTSTFNFYHIIVTFEAMLSKFSLFALDDLLDFGIMISLRLCQLWAVTSSSVSFYEQVRITIFMFCI